MVTRKDRTIVFGGVFLGLLLLVTAMGATGQISLQSAGVPTHGFLYTPVDATNITDPNTSAGVLISAVTTTVDGTLRVKYNEGAATVDIPMSAGVRRSMVLKQIYSTGTTAGITSAGVVCEY